MTALSLSARAMYQASQAGAARERCRDVHQRAEQRRFELRVEREVQGSIEDLFQRVCAKFLEKAAAQGNHSATIYIQVNYQDDKDEPVRSYWWRPGARCKTITQYLVSRLKKSGYGVSILDPTVLWSSKDLVLMCDVLGMHESRVRNMTCMHVVPILVQW